MKSELRTSDLNRQSLWADSVKMADELNYIKAKHTEEIDALKSKLAKAKETINQIRNHNEACRVAVDMYWDKASEIGEG